ncbi:ABC transporter ATP-binding protein/permease [SAR86 cluster bacterium]|uniref:ABC transporter ATP-binding protein/permease n=1 Tax=SAR86 cluster bacterium TaxID=2030880 RepID=A0A9Q8TXU6_9GAMM|nr:ABC transporter ATP-binding protein/permease [SAR86 cluster bacterium]
MKEYLIRIYSLLYEDKKRLPLLLVLFLLTSFFDALSLAILFPFIQILVNFQDFQSSYGWFFESINLTSKSEIITFLGITLVSLFIIKALASILVNWAILRITYNRQAKIKTSLLHKYLNMHYRKYIEGNSARYIQMIQTMSMQFIKVLQGFLRLLSDGLIFLSIVIVLAIVEGPLLIYVGGMMIVLLLIYDIFFKKLLDSQSRAITDSSVQVTKTVNESIQGLKEIKILGKQNFFEDILKENVDIYAKNNIYADLIRTQPKHIIELIFVIAFTLAVVFFTPLQNDFQSLIPTLGVFLFAAIRLMPTLNQMLASVNVLRIGYYPTTLLFEDMTTKQDLEEDDYKANILKDGFTSMLLKNVFFSYKNDKEHQLNGISLQVDKNKSIGLFGQSGSGKTTLVDVMLGLLEPSKGEIHLNNKVVKNNKEFRNLVAYIPQDIFIINDSVKNNITLTGKDEVIDDVLLEDVVLRSRLKEVINNLPEGINTNIGERGVKLSGGQKQRIAIARALYNKREVLIMDEATSALDNNTEKEIIDEIRKLKGKVTMVVIAHRLTTLQHCDEIYEISNGKISEKYNYEDISKSKK